MGGPPARLHLTLCCRPTDTYTLERRTRGDPLQAIEVVKTIEWIDKQIPSNMRELVLSAKLMDLASARNASELTFQALMATHEWARVLPVLGDNKAAVEVLKAFGLSRLLDDSAPVKFASLTLGASKESIHEYYSDLVSPYSRMLWTAKALVTLVVPTELQGNEVHPDVLSITIHSEERIALTVLKDALAYLEAVYELLSELFTMPQDRLVLVSIESGSPVSVNVKGSGEIVRELRLLFGDLWNRIRFKKQEEQIANNSVLVSSLDVMTTIDRKVKERALSPEAGEKIKRGLTKNMLGLINSHALPTEISEIEQVPNYLLLTNFRSKLLTSSIPPSSLDGIDASTEEVIRTKRGNSPSRKGTARIRRKSDK